MHGAPFETARCVFLPFHLTPYEKFAHVRPGEKSPKAKNAVHMLTAQATDVVVRLAKKVTRFAFRDHEEKRRGLGGVFGY